MYDSPGLFIEGGMSRACEVCGRKTQFGNQYARRGLAKAKGGVGRRITGKSHRTFKPNIQRVRAVVNGSVKRVKVCTRCIKKGAVVKPA
jgi:large subunit ribosomal protein L28